MEGECPGGAGDHAPNHERQHELRDDGTGVVEPRTAQSPQQSCRQRPPHEATRPDDVLVDGWLRAE